MRQIIAFTSFIAIITATLLMGSATAAAAEPPRQHPHEIRHIITITARVLPHQYIIVDSAGDIMEIVSNTDQDVTPKVYVHAVRKGNERNLTPELYAEYRKLVPIDNVRAGTLYKRPAPFGLRTAWHSPATTVSLPALKSLLTWTTRGTL